MCILKNLAIEAGNASTRIKASVKENAPLFGSVLCIAIANLVVAQMVNPFEFEKERKKDEAIIKQLQESAALSRKERNAATKIQALVRGYNARKELAEQTEAAIKIQSMYRGVLARKQVADLKELSEAFSQNEHANWKCAIQ